MNALDVLAIGSLERAMDGTILEANSTSTLVRTGKHLIVVDTSSAKMRPSILISLEQLETDPADIDIVVLTHTHRDHTENCDLFPNAKIIVHANSDGVAEADAPEGCQVIEGDSALCEGVDLVYTPGHTWDSMSVFVKADRKYVIAGDACPLEDNFRKSVPPSTRVCKDLSVKSLKSIAEYADVIIPGHGLPFRTGR